MSKDNLNYSSEDAVAFLRAMHKGGRIDLVVLKEGVKTQAKSFDVDRPELIEEWIDGFQGDGNIYHHVNVLAQDRQNIKAKKSDIVEVRWLHVDVDDLTALPRLKEFAPKPTAIIMSGGGYQAFWRLEQPTTDIDIAERHNKALATWLGGDNCHNADRIMRVPETVNVPNSTKRKKGRKPVVARVEEVDWTRAYPLSAFPLDPEEPPPLAGIASSFQPQSVVAVGLDDLSVVASAKIKRVIELGDDPERPRGSAEQRYPSRSEAVFHVACELARSGCPDEVIAGILINPACRISESILQRGKGAAKYALKQAASARAVVGTQWPDTFKSGAPRATMRNAVVALLRLGISFAYDRFRYRRMMSGASIEGINGEISDESCMQLRGLIITEFGFDPLTEHVRDAVDWLCLDHAYHPVRDMLDGLKWDGVPRIDTWLVTYLGAEDSAYIRAVGCLMLIAAVRRVRQPGVKFDQIVVLEGEIQGKGKSSSLQILAGPGNHSDVPILMQSTKEQMELMEGVWIYELGEVEGLSRAEVNAIKAFASRKEDRARMAYGRFTTSRPRQTLFVGTTNDNKYLRDQTGNRRFWPVKTGEIDLDALRRDRDQLWAEAAARETAGEPIELRPQLWAAAAFEQAARREEDPWLDILSAFRGKAVGEVAQVSTHTLLEKLRVDPSQQNQGQTKRIAFLMRELGWSPSKWRSGDATVRGYQRPKPPDHRDDVEF